MINYRKIERIAAELEKSLGIEEQPVQNQIEERVEKEQETTEAPVPSLEARKAGKCSECGQEKCICEKQNKQARIAHLTRLVKLAKAVKKSTKMTAKEKEEALKSIEKASKKGANVGVKKSELNRAVTTEIIKNVKQIGKLNQEIKEVEGMTLNQVIKEMKKIGLDVEFPAQILNKTFGSCNASWLIKLGPMIANIIKTYEEEKKKLDDQK